MLNVTDNTRNILFRSGLALLLAGGLLVCWALPHYDDLPNYLRLAVAIPLMSSYPLLFVDWYRNWESVQGIRRGWAIGALIAPPMLLIGSIIWLIAAPHTYG